MLGKTHLAVGIATSLAVTQPDSPQELILAMGIGGLGSLIPDIDVGTSESHRDADKIVILSCVLAFAAYMIDKMCSFDIVSRIVNNSGYYRIVLGMAMFIGICAFGKEQPHRSFMHSLLALILLSVAVGFIHFSMIPYFAAGFLSHLLTDALNYKKVRVLFPLKGGVALKLFHAHGLANNVLLLFGVVLSIVQILIYLKNILFV